MTPFGFEVRVVAAGAPVSDTSCRGNVAAMQSRRLGKTGRDVSEIGFGAWAIGGSWGAGGRRGVGGGVARRGRRGRHLLRHRRRLRRRPLRAADRRSSCASGASRSSSPRSSAAARRWTSRSYTYDNLRGWLDRSRENLGVEAVDLVQLHCPPWDVYYTPAVFAACDRLVDGRPRPRLRRERREGRGSAEGDRVSRASRRSRSSSTSSASGPPSCSSSRRAAATSGVIVRVPLASGLLTGKFTRETQFSADDHRSFNRHGEPFDVGETFAGVDYETRRSPPSRSCGRSCPTGATMAQFALRWILDHESRLDRDPGRADERAGAGERRGREPPAAARRRRTRRSRSSTGSRSRRTCTSAGSGASCSAREAVDERRRRRDPDEDRERSTAKSSAEVRRRCRSAARAARRPRSSSGLTMLERTAATRASSRPGRARSRRRRAAS